MWHEAKVDACTIVAELGETVNMERAQVNLVNVLNMQQLQQTRDVAALVAAGEFSDALSCINGLNGDRGELIRGCKSNDFSWGGELTEATLFTQDIKIIQETTKIKLAELQGMAEKGLEKQREESV